MRGSAALQTYSSVSSGHLTLFPVELAVLLLQLPDPGEESLTLLYGSPQLLSLPHPCPLSAIVLVQRLWSYPHVHEHREIPLFQPGRLALSD